MGLVKEDYCVCENDGNMLDHRCSECVENSLMSGTETKNIKQSNRPNYEFFVDLVV